MSLSHGKMYISAVKEENGQASQILDILNVPAGMPVDFTTEDSLNQASTPHYTSLDSLQQDKINTLQSSYNSLLDKYQKRNANALMKMKEGSSSKKDRTKLKDINNSLIEIGDNMLNEISQIEIYDKTLQRRINNQQDEMQRHMGYLHELGKSSDSHSPANMEGYYIMSWTIVSVLVGSLVYRYFGKGK